MLDKDGIKEKMVKAIDNTNSMSAASRLLGINYKTFRKYANEFGIFIPNQSLKGGVKEITPIEDYLTNRKKIGSSRLKKMLLARKLLEYKCYMFNCEIGNEWLGQELVLELDHINGDHLDNNLSNLRLLCPNCHSQTNTFRGRNSKGVMGKYTDDDIISAFKKTLNISQMCSVLGIRNKGGNYRTIKGKLKKLGLEFCDKKIPNIVDEKAKRVKLENKCSCGSIIKSTSTFCTSCYQKSQRRVERPTYEQLLEEINELGYVGTGRKYGVSDNAIRKWRKDYEK